ncbi:hypothetical protein DMI69_00400 [Escherichia coli]|nr:hypothetical protein [Escherichia coli]
MGHDLLISSQQDTSKYDSKQTSVLPAAVLPLAP